MDYISHHGVLGMRWGVRRYQNKDGSLTSAGARRYGVKGSLSTHSITSRKGMQRRLNDLDYAIAWNRRYKIDTDARARRYQNKSDRAKTDEKHDKYNHKAEDERIKTLKNTHYISQGKKEVERLLKQAEKLGYTINEKTTKRNVTTVGDAALNLRTYINGTKYKIKDNDNTKFNIKNMLQQGQEVNKVMTNPNSTRQEKEKAIETITNSFSNSPLMMKLWSKVSGSSSPQSYKDMAKKYTKMLLDLEEYSANKK